VATLLLVGLGIVMIYSASAIRAQERFGDPTFFLKKQLICAVLGLLAMAWAMGRDLKTFQRLTPIVVLGSLLLLLLVLVPHVGIRINGARRWIRFFGVSFQPAELAKLATILFLASYFARRQDRLDSYLDGFFPPLLLTGLMAGLIILQPNFGTAAILMAVAAGMSFIGGARVRHLLATAAAALPVFLWLILQSPHGRMRLLALVDPGRASSQASYQVIQSFYALGPGGLLGRGLGASMQKLFFLPEPHTDFIFAIVGEEMGVLGCLRVLGLFGLFLWRGTRAAVRAGDRYASHLAMGITGLTVGQAALNMGVVSGLLPTTGLPLPFVSFGGSSLTIMLFGVGILLGVSRRSARPVADGNEKWNRGMHLTPVTPRCSVPGCGGLPSDTRGIRATLRHGGSLPHLPGPTPLARGRGVPSMPKSDRVGGSAPSVGVRGLQLRGVRHGWDHLSGHAPALDALVPGYLVGDQSEDRGERPGLAAGPGTGELPDGVDVAAQTPAGHGPPRSGSPHGAGRGG
jgi:cell division protein FtsW